MRVIAVGNKYDSATSNFIEEYSTRLRGSLKTDVLLLRPAKGDQRQVVEAESLSILSRLKPGERLVLLDERGQNMTSEQFANLVEADSSRLVFVIGGAYGVSDQLKQKADVILRLSDMVLPHRLAAIVLFEQLYRAQCINTGHPYHHSD